MKAFLVACGLVVGFVLATGLAEGDEATVTIETVDEESPAAVEAAKVAGASQATTDIAGGTFQILRYGLAAPELPGPVHDRDEETGYPIYDLNNCMPTPALIARVHAYNETMRQWFVAHRK